MTKKVQKICLALALLLTILCISFIFSNSLKNSAESSEQSSAVRDFLLSLASLFGIDADINVTKLRNFAHVAEFLALGVSLSSLLLFLLRKKGVLTTLRLYTALSLGIIIGLLIAVSDELIQLFSEGRACDVKDVMLDSIGILFGTLVVLIVYLIRRRIKFVINKK